MKPAPNSPFEILHTLWRNLSRKSSAGDEGDDRRRWRILNLTVPSGQFGLRELLQKTKTDQNASHRKDLNVIGSEHVHMAYNASKAAVRLPVRTRGDSASSALRSNPIVNFLTPCLISRQREIIGANVN